MPRWRKCMDQSHEDSREKCGSATIISTSPVDPSPVVVHFADSWEKCGGDEEQLQGLASPPPQNSGVRFQSEMTKDESSSAFLSSFIVPATNFNGMSPAFRTTADRGVAVAPDVEYGECAREAWDGELAVAMAMGEEEEDKNSISAVEYGPDGKLPHLQNHRLCYYVMGCFIVFVIVTVLAIVAVVKAKDKIGTTILVAQPADKQKGSFHDDA